MRSIIILTTKIQYIKTPKCQNKQIAQLVAASRKNNNKDTATSRRREEKKAMTIEQEGSVQSIKEDRSTKHEKHIE